jgi:hypothetical protein
MFPNPTDGVDGGVEARDQRSHIAIPILKDDGLLLLFIDPNLPVCHLQSTEN